MNAEEKREYMRVWKIKNRERIRAYEKQYYEANRDNFRARQKIYQVNNLYIFRKNNKAWADKYPERWVVSQFGCNPFLTGKTGFRLTPVGPKACSASPPSYRR